MLNHHCHDLRTLTHLNKEKRIPIKQEDWTYEMLTVVKVVIIDRWCSPVEKRQLKLTFFLQQFQHSTVSETVKFVIEIYLCNTVSTVTHCKTHNRKPEVVYAVLIKIRQMKPRISFMSKGISWDWSQLLISTCPRVSSSWSKLDNLAADVTLLPPLHAAMWVPVILSFRWEHIHFGPPFSKFWYKSASMSFLEKVQWQCKNFFQNADRFAIFLF